MTEVNAGQPFNLNTISSGISTADFYLTVPSAVIRFLESDSNTKVLAKPQLRGAEGQKVTLNLGEEIPVVEHGVHADCDRRRGHQSAHVVQLPRRRRHRRNDAARDVFRRDHSRPVALRTARAQETWQWPA